MHDVRSRRFSGAGISVSADAGPIASAPTPSDPSAGVAVAFSEGAGAFTALGDDIAGTNTGTGLRVGALGARIRYTDSALGLSIEANARGLVAHQDSAYEEWGAWATLRARRN